MIMYGCQAVDQRGNVVEPAQLTSVRVHDHVIGMRDGTRIWIITEADRSVTTILLPEEY